MANLRRALLNISRILDSTAIPARITNLNPPIQSASLYRPLVGSFSRFCSSNQSVDIDLSNEESKRRLFNRLLYRSKQRGFLELDLILGKWVEEHIHSMDQNGIKSLVDVLDLFVPVNGSDRSKLLNSHVQMIQPTGLPANKSNGERGSPPVNSPTSKLEGEVGCKESLEIESLTFFLSFTFAYILW